jgi:signal transduction histidine kinase
MQGLREACHDMRQPVATVLALAAAAQSVPGLAAPARGYLERITEQAQWLAQIIEDSLRAREADGSRAATTDVARVISDAAAAQRLSWHGELRMAWPAEPLRLAMHPVAFRRIITNLLSNAARAAGQSGTVTIDVTATGGRAVIAVDDDGPGFGLITQEHRLGLTAVARAVVKHGGRLECGRSALGGARVTVRLPLWTGPRPREQIDVAALR